MVALCKAEPTNPDVLAQAFAIYKQQPDSIGASFLISAFKHIQDLAKALEVYRLLVAPSSKARPNTAVTKSMLSAHRQLRHKHNESQAYSQQLWQDVERFGVKVDDMCFHLFAAACGEEGDAATAGKIVARLKTFMAEKGTSSSSLGWQVGAVDCGQLCKAFVKGKDFARASELFGLMQTEWNLPPSVQLCALLLKGCSEVRDLSLGRRIHTFLRDSGVMNGHLASALIRMYSECGMDNEAMSLFDEISTGSNQSTLAKDEDVSSVWNAVIAAHLRKGRADAALRVFEEKYSGSNQRGRGARVRPDKMVLCSMLSICTDLKRARRFHGLVAANELDDQMLAAIIKMYSRCGSLVEALAVFENAEKKGNLGPFSWAAILSTYSTHKMDREATSLFVRLTSQEDQKKKRDTFMHPDVLSAVLPSCGTTGDLALGRWIHELVIANSIPMGDVLCSALLSMYSRAGAFDEAIQLFTQTRANKEDRGPVAGLFTWTAMIGAYGDNRFPREALATFRDMVQIEHIKPDEKVFTAVLNACSHGGLFNEAIELVEAMEKRWGVVPSVHHHNCVVDALGRAGHVKAAREYIAHAIPSDADVITWMTLLGASRIHNEVEIAKEAMRQVEKLQGTRKTAAPLVLMSNIYAADNRWKEKEHVQGQIRASKLIKTPGVSNILIGGQVHEFMVGDTRHPQSAEIHALLHQLWQDMKEAGFSPKLSTVLHDMSDEEKDSHLCHHSEKLALAFGLLSTPPGTPLVITKNLRMCPDCHEATKFIAKLTSRKISVRDASSWHHFNPIGVCGCNDYW